MASAKFASAFSYEVDSGFVARDPHAVNSIYSDCVEPSIRPYLFDAVISVLLVPLSGDFPI